MNSQGTMDRWRNPCVRVANTQATIAQSARGILKLHRCISDVQVQISKSTILGTKHACIIRDHHGILNSSFFSKDAFANFERNEPCLQRPWRMLKSWRSRPGEDFWSVARPNSVPPEVSSASSAQSVQNPWDQTSSGFSWKILTPRNPATWKGGQKLRKPKEL